MPSKKQLLRFRIELEEIEPSIWREIVVPSSYSFWDLHVAVQDAMGGSIITSMSFVSGI